MLAGGKRSTLGGELSEGYYVQPTVLEGNNRKGAHPGEHLLVAVPGCGKALACQDPIKLIDNGGNMKILCVSTPPTIRRPEIS